MNIIRILGIWYSSLFAYYYLMLELTYFFPNSLIFCFSFYEQTSGYSCLIWRYQPHLMEIRCRGCINNEGIGWCHHDMAFQPNTFRCNRPGLEKSYCWVSPPSLGLHLLLLHDGAEFSTSPSLLQGELHFLPKPLFLRKRGCNRPPVLRTATL